MSPVGSGMGTGVLPASRKSGRTVDVSGGGRLLAEFLDTPAGRWADSKLALFVPLAYPGDLEAVLGASPLDGELVWVLGSYPLPGRTGAAVFVSRR